MASKQKPKQDPVLTEKLTNLGYPDFDVLPGEDSVLMLFIAGKLICGALKALIDETVPVLPATLRLVTPYVERDEEEVSSEDNN